MNGGMDRDQSHLDRLKDGCPAAYERLAEQFEGPLFRFFLCDHRDHHLAEDQTAEVFVQLVRSLPTMKGKAEQLPAFVFAIARHVRSRRWRRTRRSQTSLDTALEVSDGRPTPHVQAANREQFSVVLTAISEMETDMRDVFSLRFIDGYSINDVADALGMPAGTVKSHIHRGRARLRAILTDTECLQ